MNSHKIFAYKYKLFEDFEENYTGDDCFRKYTDEAFAKNITFLKIGGFKIKNNHAFSNTVWFYSMGDAEKIANYFKGVQFHLWN